MRLALGARASGFGQAVGTKAGSVGDAIGQRAAVLSANVGLRADALRHALSDLKLPRLPPVREASWLGRAASRLNVFSMRRLKPRPDMHEYWERTWDAWLRLRFWQVNPVKAGWRLARDSREAMIFLFALWQERY